MFTKSFKTIISCFLIFLLFPLDSEAQFWKKNKSSSTSKSNIKQHNQNDVPELIDPNTIEDTSLRTTRVIPPIKKSKQKEKYQIDVLVPIHLNELTPHNFSHPDQLPASKKQLIYYIEGMLLAIDTLNQLGIPLDVYIHDVPNIEQSLKEDVLFNQRLSTSDLLIAHLPVSHLMSISEWSEQNEVMLFSTFSPAASDIHEQPYFYILNPKLNSHIESLLQFGQKSFPQDPKFLIYDTSSSFSISTYTQFNDFLGNNAISAFNWQHPKAEESFLNHLIPNKKNIIFCNSMDKDFVHSLLATLLKVSDDYEIVLMGMPNWKPFLSNEHYSKLHFYMTTPFYYDGHGAWSEWLKKAYVKKHGKPITEMTYRGFEMIYSLGINLQKNGNELSSQLINQHQSWILSPIIFEAKFDNEDLFLYFENTHLNIIHHYQEQERLIH